MYSLLFCVNAAALLFTSVAARRIGGGGGSGDGDSTIGFHYEAPPLESAALAFYVIFLIATLIQLGLATTYLFRAHSGHRLPGVGVVLALIFLTLDYALGIVSEVAEWAVDDFGDPSLTALTLIDLNAAQTFFWDWIDPMVFAAVVLVLRDRYLTHVKNTNESSGPQAVPLGPFLIASGIFFIMMFVFSTAYAGGYSAAYNAFYDFDGFVVGKASTLRTQLRISDDMYYTFLAIEFIATLFVIAFAVVVKKSVKSDMITTLTLTIITPLLTLRIISRIIFAILSARLPSFTLETGYAIDFASTFMFGVLFLTITSMLVHFLMSPTKWDSTGTGAAVVAGPDMYGVPQYGPSAPQYGPGAPQYGPGAPQFGPGVHPGYQPQAMFPGQWGYTGQPQLQYYGPYPYPPGQSPVPYYANQPQPPAPGGESPGEEKALEGSAPHPSQSPPPPTS